MGLVKPILPRPPRRRGVDPAWANQARGVGSTALPAKFMIFAKINNGCDPSPTADRLAAAKSLKMSAVTVRIAAPEKSHGRMRQIRHGTVPRVKRIRAASDYPGRHRNQRDEPSRECMPVQCEPSHQTGPTPPSAPPDGNAHTPAAPSPG